ncbi:MAG: 4-vinyl reductase [Candidatus Fermentibacteraceae bacterium]
MPRFVECPEPFAGLFENAESILEPIFDQMDIDRQKGAITIGGERYVMYRGDSMAVALRKQLEKVLGASTPTIIYQFGKACGAADAGYIFEKTGVEDPAMRLAMGPVAFALGGYAKVKILPQSAPAPDDSFLLVYDHPNSYEASAFINDGIETAKPVDHMNAGYSAGWCGEAFGLKLEAKEIRCRARGDDQCLFVMAPASRIRERVKEIEASL